MAGARLIVVDGKNAVIILPKTSPEEFQQRVNLQAKAIDAVYRIKNASGTPALSSPTPTH